MSQNNSARSGHGFCNAIFSNSTANCNNKENAKPSGKGDSRHCSRIGDDIPARTKTRTESKTPTIQKSVKSEQRQQTCSVNKTPISNSVKLKSSTSIQKSEHTVASNTLTDSKTPVRTPRMSSDKTPVTHLCTPKQVKSCFSVNSKMSILPSTRTPVKRFFTEHVLSQATPDCFNNVQVETPRAQINDTSNEQTIYEEESSNLTVGIRVRPMSLKELEDPNITSIVKVDGQNITIDCELSQYTFVYDHCFISYVDTKKPGHASQEVIFNSMVLPLVRNAFEGYNVCLFAYGQTGSGKSYSMMGTETPQLNSTVLDEKAGIIPRFCEHIFSQIAKNVHITYNVEISYFEIYNEKIHDLLANTNNVGAKRAPLKVREHPVLGPYIVDLSQHSVENYKDLLTWLKVGNSQRATAATGMNEKSSRSHSIFSIILTQAQKDGTTKSKSTDSSWRSKINLVDLAGSERLSQTCASGERLKEGVSINKSLLILGKVIASLAENTNNRKRGFVPYRESILTWLLKESLGGNSRTAMLGTISPASVHLEETLATLRYACQARAIVNRVRVNEDPNTKLIRDLKAEVLRLREMREGYEKQLGFHPRRLLDSIEPQTKEELSQKQKEIDLLKDQLKKTEEHLEASQRTWLEKLRDTEKQKDSELKYLRKCGIAVEFDLGNKTRQPCLVNLAADPLLSGTLFYLIPQGLVRIGRDDQPGTPNKKLDIVLNGPLVRQLHCTIENKNGKLVLSPEPDAETFVNGQAISGKVLLKHGDRLVIGGNHYFKVSNPQGDHGQISTHPIDFEFAHQELLKIQEERLRSELEESKQKAIIDLENAKREVEMQLGSQKSIYEKKIKMLGSTLEEQKHELEEINRRKRELEFEKEMLVSEVNTNNKIRIIQLAETKVALSPYKSNFLQELECILTETTADIETALKTKINKESIYAGGISLHEMQMLVREATERCREFRLNYEFNQQQIVKKKKLRPVIRVRDRDRMMETFWDPIYFIDWVHKLRDYDIEDSIKVLRDIDTNWEPYEDSEVFEDSLSNSRISVNITPVKKHLNESLYQFSLDASAIENTLGDQTFDSVISKQQENVDACLIQMEVASKTLMRLCQQNEHKHISDSVNESLEQVQIIIGNLKQTLGIRRNTNEKNDDSLHSNQSINNTVIEKTDSSSFGSSVIEQNNSNCSPCIKSGLVQKTVRFLEKK